MKTVSALVGLLVVAGLTAVPATAFADTTATATIALTSSTGPTNNYTVTLHNTGTTPIETFWMSWLPTGQDFLPSLPTNIGGPSNWIMNTTNNGGTDGYGIEYYYYSIFGGSPIPVGGNGTFTFSSTDSLATITGNSTKYPGNNVGTSFIYDGFPEADAGQQITVAATPVPEPASLGILALAAGGLLLRKRSPRIAP